MVDEKRTRLAGRVVTEDQTNNIINGDHTPQFACLPWFPRDFLSSTIEWPLVARGIYRELLDRQWDTGSLPNDKSALRQMVRATLKEWNYAWPYIKQKFPISGDGRLRNPRLESHRRKAISRSNVARDNAKKRWGNDDDHAK